MISKFCVGDNVIINNKFWKDQKGTIARIALDEFHPYAVNLNSTPITVHFKEKELEPDRTPRKCICCGCDPKKYTTFTF